MKALRPAYNVVKLADSLGYGKGTISYKDREAEVGGEALEAAVTAIQSSDILVEVSRDLNGKLLDDDGCGDGRKWKRIFSGIGDHFKEHFSSLNRAKVFGGGVAMAASSLIGLGQAAGYGLNEVFSSALRCLKERKIDFGAHTDEHAHGENCGCGALDKAPETVQNAVEYESKIKGTITALGVNDTGLDEVMGNFRSYAREIKGQPYKGTKVKEEIVSEGKVVKELKGPHLEMFIILNSVRGYTVDQELVRQATGGKVQAFAVDVWRMQDLAKRLYPDNSAEQQKAFLSELVYTLAVAATLTKGDLPVYGVDTLPVAA